MPTTSAPSITDQLRLPAGPVDLSGLDPRSTAGFPGAGKQDAPALTAELAERLSDHQERLYAAGRTDEDGSAPAVLLILQGMDTAGKGGVLRHAVGLVDPQGVSITAFKRPTPEERSHDFLWRIRRALPEPGMIGVFDRSHYEDVLVARVRELVTPVVWEQRYDKINEFEAELVAGGTTVIKCFLHVSYEEQRQRLADRLNDPDKHWKYNPGDIDERLRWNDYQAAYADALERCSTEAAPWFVVPSDRKWFRNWAVAQLLLEHLEGLGLGWPRTDIDVETELARLAAT